MQRNVLYPPTDCLGREKPVLVSYPAKKFDEIRALFGQKRTNVQNRKIAEEHVILSRVSSLGSWVRCSPTSKPSEVQTVVLRALG